MRALVAKDTRDAFASRVGPLGPLSRARFAEARGLAGAARLPEGLLQHPEAMLLAAATAVRAPLDADDAAADDAALPALRAALDAFDPQSGFEALATIFALALRDAAPGRVAAAISDFGTRASRDAGDAWLFKDYRDAFDAIPELAALVDTPFMVEIVTKILRKLTDLQSTDASMKQALTLQLGDDAAAVAWSRLSAARRLSSAPRSPSRSPRAGSRAATSRSSRPAATTTRSRRGSSRRPRGSGRSGAATRGRSRPRCRTSSASCRAGSSRTPASGATGAPAAASGRPRAPSTRADSARRSPRSFSSARCGPTASPRPPTRSSRRFARVGGSTWGGRFRSVGFRKPY